jgi:hypothetical protein
MAVDPIPPPGWLPASVTDGRITWNWFGDQALDQGFYEQDLAAARWRSRETLETSLSALPPATRAPDGLIFHMSRCGSTLLARMLAADPDNTVVSEAAPIDAAARTGDPALLRAMAGAFARPRGVGERRLFLKLDCWHTRFIPLFRAAFPDTPWIFVHREPVEVLVSHARQPGMQMIPSLVGPEVLGIAPGNPRDPAYHAAVLASVCEGALEGLALGGGLLVDYSDLPDALFDRVLPHFDVASDSDATARMRAAAGRNAKRPEAAFTTDAETKRREAGPAILAACEGRLATAHARLLSKTGVP